MLEHIVLRRVQRVPRVETEDPLGQNSQGKRRRTRRKLNKMALQHLVRSRLRDRSLRQGATDKGCRCNLPTGGVGRRRFWGAGTG